MSSSLFNDPPPTDISTLPHHDALPTSWASRPPCFRLVRRRSRRSLPCYSNVASRSEEHTSELQSLAYLVCRLLCLMIRRPPISPLFPTTTLFRPPGPAGHRVFDWSAAGRGDHCRVTRTWP